MEGSWAVLPCAGEDTVRWELCNWYNESSAADQRRGDMACTSFDYVACIEYRPPAEGAPMRVNMLQWDPYKSAWFLFYTRAEHVIRVLGGIGFWDLYDLRGVVEAASDLTRSRAFLLPWDRQVEEEAGEEEEGDGEEHDRRFYLPCMSPEQRELLGGTVMDPAAVVGDRVRWILKCESALCQEELWSAWDEDGAPVHPEGPAVEFGAVFAASLLGNVLDRLGPEGEAARKRYEKAFLFAEHALFTYRMTRYFGSSNDDVVRLFVFNGMGDYIRSIIAAGSAADNQAHARRFPGAPEPEWYYRVPVEDVPAEVASALPSHSGGTVCITIGELPAWIWTKFILARIHARTRMMMAAVVSGPRRPQGGLGPLEGHLESIATEMVCGHFRKHPHAAAWRAKRKRKMIANPVSQRERRRERLEDVDPDDGFAVADIEDLFSVAPPCLRPVIGGNGRFPRHMERLRLTQVLQHAGISYASVANFFERMNDRYPHAGRNYRDARARFDYDRAWRDNQGPSFCGNLIRNAVNKRGEDVLKCPFVDRLPGPRPRPGQPYDGLKEPCKRMCTGQANARFSGPHVLLRGALRARGPL